MSSRHLQCNIFLSFKTSSRCSWRRLEKDILQTRLEDVFKMSWKLKKCYAEDLWDVFKTYWEKRNVCWDITRHTWHCFSSVMLMHFMLPETWSLHFLTSYQLLNESLSYAQAFTFKIFHLISHVLSSLSNENTIETLLKFWKVDA